MVRGRLFTRLRLSRPLHLSCEQLTAVTESPVYALFNPVVLAAKELPITLYESGARRANNAFFALLTPTRHHAELRVVNEVPSLTFVQTSYTIEARGEGRQFTR